MSHSGLCVYGMILWCEIMMRNYLDVQLIMIANMLCYGFWYGVRCGLGVVRLNVCDMVVVDVVTMKCCEVSYCVVTGGYVKITVVRLPRLVLLCAGIWIAEVGRIESCASVAAQMDNWIPCLPSLLTMKQIYSWALVFLVWKIE